MTDHRCPDQAFSFLRTQFWKHRMLSPSFLIILTFMTWVLLVLKPGNINHPLQISQPGGKTSLPNQVHFASFDDSYVGWPLERVCSEVEWTPGLIFNCDNNSGGIGNIRNFILTCIRYAIEAGATGLVVPKIRTRSSKDLSNIFQEYEPLTYFFDENHFRTTLSTHCPHMVLLNDTNHLLKVGRFPMDQFTPRNLGGRSGCSQLDLNRHTDTFRVDFDSWLNNKNRTISASQPIVVQPSWGSSWEWPVYVDGPEFVATFGGILKIRKDIVDLAATTLAALKLYIKNTEPSSPPRIQDSFLGFHLRTESDALEFWPSFEQQASQYLDQATAHNLQFAYLACGNETEAQKFTSKAQSNSKLNVTTKFKLLEGSELTQLSNLTWDQQALVDFLVLLQSTHFMGCSPSSFSINIALKRHLMEDGLHTRPWRNPGDRFSTLVGSFKAYWDDWLFMYDSIWP